jgi:hypothetical protein
MQVIKTAIQTHKFIKPVIENLVQVTSKVESLANALYTLVILDHFESGQKFHKQWVNQSTFNACMRGIIKPGKPVEYKHETIADKINELREKFVKFPGDSEPFGMLSTFSQLVNATSRRFITVLVNNIFMRMESWLTKTVRLQLVAKNQDKKEIKNLTRVIIRTLMQKPLREEDQKINLPETIMADHRNYLDEIYTLKITYKPNGYLDDGLIQKYPHMYLRYALFLQRKTEDLLIQTHDPTITSRPKAPFCVIPQLTFKTRSITLGKEQTTELVKWLFDSKQYQGRMEHICQSVIFPGSGDVESLKIAKTNIAIEEMQSKIEDLESKIANLDETKQTKVRSTIDRQKEQISKKQNTLDKLVGTKRKREEKNSGKKKQKSQKKNNPSWNFGKNIRNSSVVVFTAQEHNKEVERGSHYRRNNL